MYDFLMTLEAVDDFLFLGCSETCFFYRLHEPFVTRPWRIHGERCNLHGYIKFIHLLPQGTKPGMSDPSALLPERFAERLS
jgi:hypothetical protein